MEVLKKFQWPVLILMWVLLVDEVSTNIFCFRNNTGDCLDRANEIKGNFKNTDGHRGEIDELCKKVKFTTECISSAIKSKCPTPDDKLANEIFVTSSIYIDLMCSDNDSPMRGLSKFPECTKGSAKKLELCLDIYKLRMTADFSSRESILKSFCEFAYINTKCFYPVVERMCGNETADVMKQLYLPIDVSHVNKECKVSAGLEPIPVTEDPVCRNDHCNLKSNASNPSAVWNILLCMVVMTMIALVNANFGGISLTRT